MKKFLLFIFMAFMPAFANAANYYIDCQNGNDSNSGTSSGSPWKSPSKVSGVDFLSAGDTVNFNKGTTCSPSQSYFNIQSSGASGNPITLQAYGSGANPIFDGSVATSSIAGWTGWTLYNATYHIWKSNIPLPFSSLVPIVDGTSTYGASTFGLGAAFYPCHYTQSGGYMYVRTCDNSDPNGHTYRFAQYPPYPTNLYGALVYMQNSDGYINIDHLDFRGSNVRGLSIGVPHVNITNSTSKFNAQEGFLFSMYGEANPEGSSYSSCTNCTSQWNNGGSPGGTGQNITVNSHDVTVDNALIEYGWMAGFDFLDFNSSTNSSNNVLKNSIIRYNSQRSMWGGCAAYPTQDFNGFDPQVYVDGGHHNAILNNVIIGNVLNSTYCGYLNQNASYGIQIGGENINKTPHDVYIINNLVYLNVGPTIGGSHVATGLPYNFWIIGNTIRSAFYISVAFNTDTLKGRSVHFWNNIFTGSLEAFRERTDSDYNIFDVAGSGSNIGYLDGGTNVMTLAQWQAASGQDAHSLTAPVLYVTDNSNFHLQQTASGQASNSPALGAGLANPDNIQRQLILSSIGTTRTDDVVDDINSLDLGYHFNQIIDSWNFINIPQEGTTWIPGGTIQ